MTVAALVLHGMRGRGAVGLPEERAVLREVLPAISVFLKGPTGIALDGAGNLLVCEEGGHRVWRLTPENPAGRRTADRDRR